MEMERERVCPYEENQPRLHEQGGMKIKSKPNE